MQKTHWEFSSRTLKLLSGVLAAKDEINTKVRVSVELRTAADSNRSSFYLINTQHLRSASYYDALLTNELYQDSADSRHQGPPYFVIGDGSGDL